MRIGTYNIERMGRGQKFAEQYKAKLESLNTDVLVVTEPGPHFRNLFPEALMSPEDRRGRESPEAWVAIVGKNLEDVMPDIPYTRLAVAARAEIDGQRVIVYGSVLPWNSAQHHAPDVYGDEKRPFMEIFEKALNEQVGDMEDLRRRYPQEALIWAGDFNHTLEGRALSRGASELLRDAISKLGLKAVNADSPHRAEGMKSLDLICVESSWTCSGIDFDYPEPDGRPLSDHRWYVAEVGLSKSLI
jgi:hypothetical protein